MKKKRKKSISLFCLAPFQVFTLSNATFEKPPSLSSAPDVLTGANDDDGGLESCVNFAEELFGGDAFLFSLKEKILLRSFVRQLSEKNSVCWDTVQVDKQLFVRIPTNANKDSFVALLDYAEEHLDVEVVIACIERHSQSCPALVKAFRFMGFEHVAPDVGAAEYGVPRDSSFLLLGYELE